MVVMTNDREYLIVINNYYNLLSNNEFVLLQLRLLGQQGWVSADIFVISKKLLLTSILVNFKRLISGFCISVILYGVGYKCSVVRKVQSSHASVRYLWLKLRLSHYTLIRVPNNVFVYYYRPKKLIHICSTDQIRFNIFISQICQLRRPDIYEGKGLYLATKRLVLKVGKVR